jgi:hypothetical protein
LTALLHSESAETRYGAFRALWSFDKQDPVVKGEPIGEEFYLHLISSKAPPMAHISRNFRREIVLFDSEQKLLTPLSLRAGEFIMLNVSPGADEVHLASFRPGPRGVIERRSHCSLALADVLREVVKLGATYPDVVEMLQQASANGNLVGRLEINALPEAVRLETLESIANKSDSVAHPLAGMDELPSLFAVPGRGGSGGFVSDPDLDADEPETDKKTAPKKRSPFDIFRRNAN